MFAFQHCRLFCTWFFETFHPYGLYLIKIWQEFQTPIWPKGGFIIRSDLTHRDRVTAFETMIKTTSSHCWVSLLCSRCNEQRIEIEDQECLSLWTYHRVGASPTPRPAWSASVPSVLHSGAWWPLGPWSAWGPKRGRSRESPHGQDPSAKHLQHRQAYRWLLSLPVAAPPHLLSIKKERCLSSSWSACFLESSTRCHQSGSRRFVERRHGPILPWCHQNNGASRTADSRCGWWDRILPRQKDKNVTLGQSCSLQAAIAEWWIRSDGGFPSVFVTQHRSHLSGRCWTPDFSPKGQLNHDLRCLMGWREWFP